MEPVENKYFDGNMKTKNLLEKIGLEFDFVEQEQVDLLNGSLQLAYGGDGLQVYHIISKIKKRQIWELFYICKTHPSTTLEFTSI